MNNQIAILFSLCLCCLSCQPFQWASSSPASTIKKAADTTSHDSFDMTSEDESVDDRHGLAYVVDQRELHILLADQASPTTARYCQSDRCTLLGPRWSFDGELILFSEDSALVTNQLIHVVDKLGNRVGAIQDVNYLYPIGSWSPDSHELAFLRNTDRAFTQKDRDGSSNADISEVALEVWVASIDNGSIVNEKMIGEVFSGGIGCGGNSSPSADLYMRESSIAFGPSLMIEWAKDNILLFQVGCAGTGVERFDMSTAEQLQPYPPTLRHLQMKATKDAWVGVIGNESDRNSTQIAIGDPTSTTWRVIDSIKSPSLVYWGHAPNTFFYTFREWIETKELLDNSGNLISIVEYYTTSLRYINISTGDDEMLYESDSYGIASIVDQGSDGLFFVEIENDRKLEEAINQGVRNEALNSFLPRTQILHMSAVHDMQRSNPTMWQINSGQIAIYQP